MSHRHTTRATKPITLLAALLSPALLFAQGSGPLLAYDTLTAVRRPTGSVTGTVIDQDTQHPVRLAYVFLQPVQPANQTNGPRQGFMIRSGSQRSGLDGAFTIEGVAPGDYYVNATAAGYVSERALLLAQIAAGAQPDDVLRQVPIVHVETGAAGPIAITLQRGGAIGGLVQWDDGAPASGVQINVQPATPPAAASTQALPQFFGGSNSPTGVPDSTVDDRGDFRLSGLAPGDYILEASIPPEFHPGQPSYPIRIYSPGVFRRSQATPVTVRAGDERTDVRMVLRLNGLRTVSGTVGAASGSAGVHSGTVSLADTTDSTIHIAGSIATDGSFTLDYVPPGNYTMTAQGSAQGGQNNYHRGSNPTETTTFAPLIQPLQVGSADITGLTINLAAH